VGSSCFRAGRYGHAHVHGGAAAPGNPCKPPSRVHPPASRPQPTVATGIAGRGSQRPDGRHCGAPVRVRLGSNTLLLCSQTGRCATVASRQPGCCWRLWPGLQKRVLLSAGAWPVAVLELAAPPIVCLLCAGCRPSWMPTRSSCSRRARWVLLFLIATVHHQSESAGVVVL